MMRHSLKGTLRRLDRFAVCAVLAEPDLAKLSTGELHAHLFNTVEQLIGSPLKFANAEAYVVAVLRKSGDPVDQLSDSPLSSPMREHWERTRWFADHRAHGPFGFEETPYTPGLLARCACGASLSMYWQLVPPEFRPRPV